MIQFCAVALLLASLPGNKFVNGIVFGAAEVGGMIVSQVLMDNLYDLTAFAVIYFTGALGYLLLIFFPGSSWTPYLGVLLSNASIGSWLNVACLIVELRVPPQSVASFSAIVRTLSLAFSLCAPTISQLPGSWSLIVLAGVSTSAFLLSLLLPKPGQYLQNQAQKTGDNTVVLLD